MEKGLSPTFLILVYALGLTACHTDLGGSNGSPVQSPSVSFPSPEITPLPTQNLDSSIRNIDFRNFTYPETEDYPGFSLKDGEKPYVHRKEDGISFGRIEYGDLTQDGREDAVILLGIQTGGSAIPLMIYVYSLERTKPKLLWAFMTGDRADGGLKELYLENHLLVLEFFGESRLVNGQWEFSVPEEKYAGAGRPTLYTKNRLKWDGKQFVVEGTPEIFDIEQK